MVKTIVNIITEDNPIPGYLFIKEMYEEGDRLMYISAKDTEDDLDLLAEIDGVPSDIIEEVVLKNDMDEITYERICRTVKSHLKQGTHYCVNLAGGTRYMALAVQQVFEDYDSEFFYTDVEDNIIIKSKFDDNIYDNDDCHFPIKYRMSLSEYLSAHEIKSNLHKVLKHQPSKDRETALSFFDLFSQNLLSRRDWDILENLRHNYRGKYKYVTFDMMRHPQGSDVDPIDDIAVFLKRMNFVPDHTDSLSKSDLDYLTGGWFEEYVYYLIKDTVSPQDISLNVTIHFDNVKRQNELDVIFMIDNKLHVIECKTGVATVAMFNEIVYKACALKEALLGVSCKSYIFSLKQDSEGDDLQRIATNLGIDFWDRDVLTNNRLLCEKIRYTIGGCSKQ